MTRSFLTRLLQLGLLGWILAPTAAAQVFIDNVADIPISGLANNSAT